MEQELAFGDEDYYFDEDADEESEADFGDDLRGAIQDLVAEEMGGTPDDLEALRALQQERDEHEAYREALQQQARSAMEAEDARREGREYIRAAGKAAGFGNVDPDSVMQDVVDRLKCRRVLLKSRPGGR